MENQLVDHLFRHQFGKMVSILVRIFGMQHLETIEDAIQDTFITAMKSWKNQIPDNPEAWLTAASKNRVLDIFRKINAEQDRNANYQSGTSTIGISEMFLDHQIEDSQLRMIFTACHPELNPKDQIAFALKTISGFSPSEIASALLTPVDTIKKRLQRARKTIVEKKLEFAIPEGIELNARMDRVMEVMYVIFNEGFHSGKQEILVRQDLCMEAMRLCTMILKKDTLQNPKLHALFALMCFHSSRLESKVSDQNEIISLKDQDRKLWNRKLFYVGNEAMNKATEDDSPFTSYHYEAAIAYEHLRAIDFDSTDWDIILKWYQSIYQLQASEGTLLNIAVVNLQLQQYDQAKDVLDSINVEKLAQRGYLHYACLAEYYHLTDQKIKAIKNIDIALELVSNQHEKKHLEEKRNLYSTRKED